MELLSIILLCVFIPVTVILILCLLCLFLYWKKKWKSQNRSDDLETHGDIRSRNKSKDDVKDTFRFQDEIHRKDKHEEIPLMALGESDRTILNTDQQYLVETTGAEKRQKPKTTNSIRSNEKTSQTTYFETVDEYTQTVFAVANECTQTDECEHLPQDEKLETFEKSGQKREQKKKSKATKRSSDGGYQDGAKQNKVEERNVLEFDPPKGNKNLGNTCFFNSSLQALYFTKSFEDALSFLKTSIPSFHSLKLTNRLLDLLEKKNVNHTQELRGLLNAVRSINSQFGRGTQEDSYELLNTLLGGILDELRNASGNGTCEPKDGDTGECGISLKNLFTGLFITIFVYDSCNDVEVDFEDFTTLSISIVKELDQDFDKLPHHGLQTISSEEPHVDIEKGLAVLTQVEDYEERDLPCRICNIEGAGKAYKRMLVFQPPPVLVIHIDRFKMNDSNHLTKNATCVQYPRRFNMSKFCSVANTELSTNNLNYELYAVVVHSGALGGGHYYAYVNTTRSHDVKKWQEHLNRSTGNLEELKAIVEDFLREKRALRVDSRYTEMCEVKDNWFYVSDNNVCSANVNEVLCHKDAYILFYEVQ